MSRQLLIVFFVSALWSLNENELFSIEHHMKEFKLAPGDSVLILPHRFVVDGSVEVKNYSGDSPLFELINIEGKLIFSELYRDTMFLSISYNYLNGDIPVFVDSPINILPQLDKKITQKPMVASSGKTTDRSLALPIVADGIFSRSFGSSPSSGTNMNGGLQLNLQGKLSENMTITGVLSDQNSPIQPSGDTRSLDEIDKVYIEVNHPSGLIKAGDIDLFMRSGRYQQHDRRLEGLSLFSNNDNVKMDMIIGSARGKHHAIEHRGEDQNQGPYTLTDDNGGRRIMVTAGSERVWLNGEELKRGESAHYTIDYSQAEITFTPKKLIDSNSRIYVEYEYSDFGYQRQVSAASVSRQFSNKRGSFSLNWIREADNTSNQSFLPRTSQERLAMTKTISGPFKKSLAVQDSAGDYVLDTNPYNISDSIFIYVGQAEGSETQRYAVGFTNAGSSGYYVRRVTAESQLYFEYVPDSQRKEHSELYVPWKLIATPKVQQVANLTTDFILSDETALSLELAGSGFNPNRLSSYQNHKGGIAGELSLTHKGSLTDKLGEVSIQAEMRGSGDGFKAIQRESLVEFWREWNLERSIWDSVQTSREGHKVSQIKFSHELPKAGITSLMIGNYKDRGQKSQRRQLKSHYTNQLFSSISIDLSDVKRVSFLKSVSNSRWHRDRFRALLFKGNIHPYFRREQEVRTNDMKFDETGTGIEVEKKLIRGNLGIVKRNDFIGNGQSPGWKREGESWLGEIDLKARPIKALNTTLTLKHRLKLFGDDRKDLNYRLARGSIRYNPKRGNTRASMDFRLERSLYEEKIVVYDSVAYGVGQYRYDSSTGLYIEDPAGHFNAFHLPSGNRLPATRLVTGVRLNRRFREYSNHLLRDITFRLIASTDYTGQEATFRSVIAPSLYDIGLNRARLNSRVEIRYTPGKKHRRIVLKGSGNREVIAKSVQESRDRLRHSVSFNWEEPVNQDYTVVLDLSKSRLNHQSTISLWDRTSNGWYSQTGLRWRRDQFLQLGGDLILGNDMGTTGLGRYNVKITGGELETLIFPGRRGRINGTLEVVKVYQNNNIMKVLPPEAARGMQPGLNLRASVTALVNLTEILVLNLNSTYLNDKIHRNFLMITGELRASF